MSADLDLIRGLLNVNDLVTARLAMHSRRLAELDETIAELRDELHELATKLERQQSKTILEAVAEVTAPTGHDWPLAHREAKAAKDRRGA